MGPGALASERAILFIFLVIQTIFISTLSVIRTLKYKKLRSLIKIVKFNKYALVII